MNDKEIQIDKIQGEWEKSKKECSLVKIEKENLEIENKDLKLKVAELEDQLKFLSKESNLKNGEFDEMRKKYERQIAEKNT